MANIPVFRYAKNTSQGLTWYEATDVVDRQTAKDGENVITYASTAENDERVVLRISEPTPGVKKMHWTLESGSGSNGATSDVEWVECHYPVAEDERFYGFGETYGSLDQRGKELRLWVENGCVRDLSYKPIPFSLSSAGYGIYLEHNELIYARMATPDIGSRVEWKVNSSQLVLYRIEAEDIAGIIDKYTAWVGRPTLPPPWFFGPWKSRDWRTENQQTVLLDLQKQRELGIPCSVKLIDAAWEKELNDFNFHPEKFPDFSSVMKEAERLQYQVVLWISPWVAEWAEIYPELDQKGYFLRRPDGSTYVHRLANNPGLRGSMIDFTNPEAKKWWQEKIEMLMELGVRGIKTDFGEQVPADARFYNGETGKTMHNLYPVLYNEATHEIVSKYNGILLGRSAWSGSQAFTGIWAGDQTADFAPQSGMLPTIYAGQNVGLSGFPYWGSDIGGYFGTPDRECFIRWTQYAAFTPCMELHGLGERDPWDMDQEAQDNYRYYTSLHTRLFPYMYRLAIEGSRRGTPMMRAMMLHYNDDRRIHELECVHSQYMFGEDLLVAPVFFEGRERDVYLPAGDWIDAWSGERVSGPWNGKAKAELDHIPVWFRAGAIVPMLPEGIETIGQYDDPERWMDVLGEERWEFVLAPGNGSYELGGVRIEQQFGKDRKLTVRVDRDETKGVVPERIVLKVRLPLSERERWTVHRGEAANEQNTADVQWKWTEIPFEAGVEIGLTGNSGSEDVQVVHID